MLKGPPKDCLSNPLKKGQYIQLSHNGTLYGYITELDEGGLISPIVTGRSDVQAVPIAGKMTILIEIKMEFKPGSHIGNVVLVQRPPEKRDLTPPKSFASTESDSPD